MEGRPQTLKFNKMCLKLVVWSIFQFFKHRSLQFVGYNLKCFGFKSICLCSRDQLLPTNLFAYGFGCGKGSRAQTARSAVSDRPRPGVAPSVVSVPKRSRGPRGPVTSLKHGARTQKHQQPKSTGEGRLHLSFPHQEASRRFSTETSSRTTFKNNH